MAPRETENNAYANFWGDKQRALWYVVVFLEWQKLQNRAARILNYSDYDPEVEPLFQQLNWTQLARRRELHTVNMVYKCTHGLAPEYSQDRFVNRVSNLISLSPAPIILKIVFVIAGGSYGMVCLRLFGKQNPYTLLNLAARNSSNSIH